MPERPSVSGEVARERAPHTLSPSHTHEHKQTQTPTQTHTHTHTHTHIHTHTHTHKHTHTQTHTLTLTHSMRHTHSLHAEFSGYGTPLSRGCCCRRFRCPLARSVPAPSVQGLFVPKRKGIVSKSKRCERKLRRGHSPLARDVLSRLLLSLPPSLPRCVSPSRTLPVSPSLSHTRTLSLFRLPSLSPTLSFPVSPLPPSPPLPPSLPLCLSLASSPPTPSPSPSPSPFSSRLPSLCLLRFALCPSRARDSSLTRDSSLLNTWNQLSWCVCNLY